MLYYMRFIIHALTTICEKAISSVFLLAFRAVLRAYTQRSLRGLLTLGRQQFTQFEGFALFMLTVVQRICNMSHGLNIVVFCNLVFITEALVIRSRTYYSLKVAVYSSFQARSNTQLLIIFIYSASINLGVTYGLAEMGVLV